MKPVSFNAHALNDGTNYISAILPDAYGLPTVNVILAARTGKWPLIGGIERPGRTITLQIIIVGADSANLQKQLYQWFDPEDETPGTLILEDDAGGNNRYVKAICQAMQPIAGLKGKAWIASLEIDNDVRLREVTAATDSWNITATGQTKVLTNNGQDDAYPILTITPTSNKTGGYSYKRWIPVKWLIAYGVTRYPTDICNDAFDTAALVTGGKMQSDGDDLRVWVDGVEVNRWLDGINTTTTKVWVNLDFYANPSLTLRANIGAGDTSLQAGELEQIDTLPQNGILYIGTEAIAYTAKNNSSRTFSGLTRGAKGTTAATHTAGDTIWWIQHDVWILYGNATASAPTVPLTYKPIFNLATSSNTSWDYDDFYDIIYPNRSGTWNKSTLSDSPRFYGGNQGATASTYVELGLECYPASGVAEARFSAWNPCGITNANFANGEKYSTLKAAWSTGTAKIQSQINGEGWITEYNIPAPSADATWEAWTRNQALTTDSVYVALYCIQYSGINSSVEASDVTLTLNSANTPIVAIGAEQGNYSLDCTITNNTTGVAIQLTFTMALNEDLEVDTDDKEIVYLLDNSKQGAALTLVGGTRRDWLALQPGANTLQFDDTGTAGVTIGFSWEERHYQ